MEATATLRVTRNGYNQFLSEISQKEKELGKLTVGDFEELWSLKKTISDMKSKLSSIEIIEEISSKDSSVVSIGSTVEVELKYDDDDTERIKITISGDYNPDSSSITLNSPLASCIFGKPTGFSGFYHVGSSKIQATILSIE